MNTTKVCSLMLILFLSIGVGFAQGRGQGRGPVGVPPAVGHSQIDHGGDHGPGDHGQANKPSTSPQNEVSTRLSKNTALTSKLQGLVPGTDLQAAAGDFKNLGQLVAAVHVSKNLNIPFDQLRTTMTTTDHKTLGDAIHFLKPELSTTQANTEAKKADDQAKEDIKTTS
jgi:hypothetical protein